YTWTHITTPIPHPPLFRSHNMFGSLAATASEPMDATASESKIGSQWIPPSLLLKMPPDAAPTYQMFGLPGTPATAVARRPAAFRSEEHTSELQSLRHLVCR